MLVKKSYSMMSRRLPTKLHETVKDMSSTLDTMPGPESQIYGGKVDASVVTQMCEDGDDGNLRMV